MGVRKVCPQHGERDQHGLYCNQPMGTRLACGQELHLIEDDDEDCALCKGKRQTLIYDGGPYAKLHACSRCRDGAYLADTMIPAVRGA